MCPDKTQILTMIKDSIRTFLQAFAAQLRMIGHDQGVLVFLVLLPLAYPLIYSLIYNPELVRDVKMVVVDHDCTPLSRELVRRMDATEQVRIIGYAAQMGEARRAMAEHECFGILEIPEHFERDATDGVGTQMVLYSDMSLLLRYRSFLLAATNVSLSMGSELLTRTLDRTLPLAETVAVGDPMGIDAIEMGDITSGFDSFIMPGIVVLILQQSLILAIGMVGGARREYPYIMGVNPLKRPHHTLARMLGQMLCFFLLAILPAIWVLHYVPLIFAFPMAGSPFEEMLFITPVILASIAMGMCLQVIVHGRENVFIIWVVTSVIFLFLSGLTWPRFSMTPVWKTISDLVPATWGVEGFIRMNSNGASLSQVAPDYRASWILTGAYTIVAYLLQRFVMQPAIKTRFIVDTGTFEDADSTAASES